MPNIAEDQRFMTEKHRNTIAAANPASDFWTIRVIQ
jgi:hypothetical protein